jgi:hypothetical protein
MTKTVEPSADLNAPRATGRLPSGYIIAAEGVYFESKEGELEWLCSPIAVTATFRAVDGSGWGRVIEVTNPDGALTKLTVMKRDFIKGAV